MSKTILGLDLGVTSIGWAFINEADSRNPEEMSSIIGLGVRVNPLTTDEQTNFEKGKPASENAGRTLKRGMRRNLDRYQLRRDNLIEILKSNKILSEDTILAEDGKGTTHSTYFLRSKACTDEITLNEFSRVLLMINKKRGYRSSRKVKVEEDGTAIDGMDVAKILYEKKLTPGQYCYQLLKEGKKFLPDFYRSDLKNEFEKVWSFQKEFYLDAFTDELKKELEGKGQRATSAIFWTKAGFNIADNKGTRNEKKLQAYKWRSEAVSKQLSKEEAAFVITEINNNINNSSGYLGAISDRSKELYFNKLTVGQFLYNQLKRNPHTSLTNQVFYRQDYLDEFETIWQTQAKFYPQLTDELKEEIRDVVIFYQRKLKSQKSQVSFCEFENKVHEYEDENGKLKKRIVGLKVCPKSSPLFQEFKIWQVLGHIRIINKQTAESYILSAEQKKRAFNELNILGNISKLDFLKLLGFSNKEYELNYNVVEGNRYYRSLYDAFVKMMEQDMQDEIDMDAFDANGLKSMVAEFFNDHRINPTILEFDAEGKAFETQSSFQLWHLLYSYEGDTSPSGNDLLVKLLQDKFGFKPSFGKILSNVGLSQDYGNISAKAIRKIFTYLKENDYAEACKLAGYNHSSSLTKSENEYRSLLPHLELLKKNELRNPVVEKTLNQMVNVVNAIIDEPGMGKPDEIRIELSRELKKNAKERAEMTESINKANLEHQKIFSLLRKEFGIKHPTRNNIIKYKLYDELKNNGYKTLYSNIYIPQEKLFTKEFDVEHIIPKSILFDDSFSNKTLETRKDNLNKGNETAVEYIERAFGDEELEKFKQRIEALYKSGQSNRETREGISKAKYQKLLKYSSDIGKGFIERDLRDSQYIARKAKQMLEEICRTVTSTSGEVTAKLRDDWGLVNVMQELNINKYRKLGLTEMQERLDGNTVEKILDWTKRNDHRHHAMDALTVAFTKREFIKYLNNLNAKSNKDGEIYRIQQLYTEQVLESDGSKKRKFKEPIKSFRAIAKEHLENILVSIKAKNKVVTRNKNKVKVKCGIKTKTELTPRAQLHKETIYGKMKVPVTKIEKVNAKFDKQTIEKVTSPLYRTALLARLIENNNDPKKAFTGKNAIGKTPIYLNEEKTEVVPEQVMLKWFEDDFTIRKNITPDLKIEKVVDSAIRKILEERIEQFNGSAKEAFSNLTLNPIWLNKEKGIAIKRVTISGVKNAEALHTKKDHLGNEIMDKNGNKIPADFVSTGSNHHLAVYKDEDGNLQDNIVSYFEAIARVNQGLPIVDKNLNGWQFLFTLKQNEMFLFPANDFDPNEIDLLDPNNNKIISKNLFRVQKISKVDYGNSSVRDFVFRHHLETSVLEKKELRNTTYIQLKSLEGLKGVVKVRINHLGKIVKVGEY